ncbi:MAG TPA: carbon-nitrogen hydrolase family protein [Anaeromyxobacteraceae bacterium]
MASTFRIALAQLPYPEGPEDALRRSVEAIRGARLAGAALVCFPEAYVPGYRGLGRAPPPPSPTFLERAWSEVARAAGQAQVSVVLGTERVVEGGLRITALVVGSDGDVKGFQDKVQLAPSEDGLYTAGAGRRLFTEGPLTFGVVICHEGARYPETVRWATRQGAQVVFHPHLEVAEPGEHRPTRFLESESSYHEKAMVCRAAENTIYYASVNYAERGAQTSATVVGPDADLVAWQPYGEAGLLVADLELARATGLLARRYRPIDA